MKRTVALLVPLLALGLAGCAGLFSTYDVTPSGLYRGDEELRRYLAQGRAETALKRVTDGHRSAPTDELLRLLYEGVTARYAGRYPESAAALDRAAALADDRRPPSASRTVLAVATNDRVLPFTAGTTERLLIHYYAALSHLDAGNVEAAAVEARRLGFLLQLRDGAGGTPDRRRDAVLRYFTGTIFEAAGEANDAGVAYRQAARLLGTSDAGVSGPAGSLWTIAASASADTAAEPRPDNPAYDDLMPDPLPDGYGEVVVFLEQGFVAHRAEESLNVVLTAGEAHAFADGGASNRTAAATAIAARILADPGFRSDLAYSGGYGRTRHIGGSGDRGSPYLLRVAWPTYHRDLRVAPAPSLLVEDAEPATFRVAADLSEAVIADFGSERLAILTRSILRAAAKFMVTQEVEERTRRRPARNNDEDDEDESEDRERERWWLSTMLGALTNIGGAVLEQADTRSWNLLPDRIAIARVQLPAGQHTLRVRVPGGIGVAPRSLEIGPVQVRPGEITFASERLW